MHLNIDTQVIYLKAFTIDSIRLVPLRTNLQPEPEFLTSRLNQVNQHRTTETHR